MSAMITASGTPARWARFHSVSTTREPCDEFRLDLTAPDAAAGRGVLVGGPVERERGFVLHTDDWISDDTSLPIVAGLAMTGTREALTAMTDPETGPGRSVLLLGYAGWGEGQLEDELAVIINHGGKILDVIVEHPVYGELKANLMLTSRKELEEFLHRLAESDAYPLATVTGGVHLHTIEVPDEKVLDRIKEDLRAFGLLMK